MLCVIRIIRKYALYTFPVDQVSVSLELLQIPFLIVSSFHCIFLWHTTGVSFPD